MIIFQTIYNVVTCISFDNLSISYRLQTWMLCSTLFPQVETMKIQEIFLQNRRHQTTSVSFRNLGYFWYFQYLSFRYWNLRYKLLPLRKRILLLWMLLLLQSSEAFVLHNISKYLLIGCNEIKASNSVKIIQYNCI